MLHFVLPSWHLHKALGVKSLLLTVLLNLKPLQASRASRGQIFIVDSTIRFRGQVFIVDKI